MNNEGKQKPIKNWNNKWQPQLKVYEGGVTKNGVPDKYISVDF